ncbi:mRNA 3'-end processing factor [Granulibacter bethesdensis]|nr:mRNA 3'-end processing factor [Granulibacter bethesdensis]
MAERMGFLWSQDKGLKENALQALNFPGHSASYGPAFSLAGRHAQPGPVHVPDLLMHLSAPHPETWLRPLPQGLYCEPADLFIDPVVPVERAAITHAHADHARPGHGAVLATPETLAIMKTRMGVERAARSPQPLSYGEKITINDVGLRMEPAGHVLGSAQIVLEWRGSRVVISGDYKRAPDPSCAIFQPVPCDVFVTEATFALPVFRHPPAEQEIRKLFDSLTVFPERTHLVGCYALGKCQRLIMLLRQAGWVAPIYLHGALMNVCRTYEALGVGLGDLRPVTSVPKEALRGGIVLAPPSALADRWSRRLHDPVPVLASGWMQVRQRARAKGVELPLVISDHADWDALLATIRDVQAPEIWVTHGREEALIHAAGLMGVRGRALRLIGYGEEDDDIAVAGGGITSSERTEAITTGGESV